MHSEKCHEQELRSDPSVGLRGSGNRTSHAALVSDAWDWPWFHNEHFAFDSFVYGGERYDGIELSVAMANSGDMQIELIEQRCQTPSMYLDFLTNVGEGLQHIAFWPDDYEAAYRQALEAGYEVGQEGQLPRGRFAYFRSAGHAGTVFEFNEITPVRREIINTIRQAALDWDGSEPIRRS